MKKNIYILLITLNCLTLFSQKKIEHIICQTTFKFPSYEFVENKIAKEWDFELPEYDESCTNQKRDSLNYENEKFWSRIDFIHGKNSKERFYWEVDDEYKRVKDAKKILGLSEKFQGEIRKLKKNKAVVSMTLKNIENKNMYTWNVYTVRKEKGHLNKKDEFDVIVYLKDKKIKINRL